MRAPPRARAVEMPCGPCGHPGRARIRGPVTRVRREALVSSLDIEVAPEEVGLDADRLRRIDGHFEQYVASGKLPGWLALVARRGRVAHLSTCGMRDIDEQLPELDDTVFRIYSMTKPVTSVAAMMLHERGAFELTDPVADFIPSFADLQVYTGGSA